MLDRRVAYLDRQLEIKKGKLVMSLYDKQDDFPFKVQNYPHLDSKVPCIPLCGVFISQLLRFARTCDRYSDFLARHKRLVRCEHYLTRVFDMASSAENSNSFTGPTIP